MKKLIIGIDSGSIAEELGIAPGDFLIAIDAHEILDVFDYRLATASDALEILIEKQGTGEEWLLEIEKDEDEDLGLVFETGLMDDVRSCKNNCIFCFVHQNPRGKMRDTIYFKDDDYRLSYLHGNYITLTNMTDDDADRILAHRLSPINISVHTTNPALRAAMMGNDAAGHSLEFLRRLADGGIDLGLQIVLCKGFNDGAVLDKTITDLGCFMHQHGDFSLSVVPAGLTRHRDGLPALQAFSAADCRAVISQVAAHQKYFLEKYGTRFVFCADEFYVKGDVALPDFDTYEEFLQIENGVGMMAAFKHDFNRAFNRDAPIKGKFVVATGLAAHGFFKEICRGLDIEIAAIDNNFFGQSVTVAGLLTGDDIITQLKNNVPRGTLLIPTNMLRAGEEVFLDDVSIQDVSRALKIEVVAVHPDGASFVEALTG